MPRYFTIEQAELLLPQVEQLLRDALFQKAEAQKAHQEFEDIGTRIRMSGGVRVDHGKLLAIRTRRDAAMAALNTALNQINDLGAMVKDLDIGLIDFSTLYQDREVYLCWKFGETSITCWHAIEDGFRGRKPIDQEFRGSHRGETPSSKH
jgi:hypothetical protein